MNHPNPLEKLRKALSPQATRWATAQDPCIGLMPPVPRDGGSIIDPIG